MSIFSMIQIFSRGSWTLCSLLYVSFLMLTWCAPISAAELKDIRVGEYKGFTRIVFELDQPAVKPGIKIKSSNHLLVTFNKTKANLVRHIPVERSPHVEEIQFWQRKAALSMLLIFEYPHIRFESFRLSRPPRFAVDVFPVANPAMDKGTPNESPPTKTVPSDDQKKTSEGTSKQSTITTDAPSKPALDQGVPTVGSEDKATSRQAEAPSPLSDSKKKVDKNDDEQIAPQVNTTDTKDKVDFHKPPLPIGEEKRESSNQVDPSLAQRTSKDLLKTSTEPAPSPPTRSESTDDIEQNADNKVAKTPPQNNRLQFYLVIILVIITIAILLLLLLMLLTRHQLFYDKDALSAAEISQHQDKNAIAELDSNIKAQLKRYDGA